MKFLKYKSLENFQLHGIQFVCVCVCGGGWGGGGGGGCVCVFGGCVVVGWTGMKGW